MALYHAIKHLFPNAVLEKDFEIQNDTDGRGDYIKAWRLPAPIPTAAQLEQAEKDYATAESAQATKKSALKTKLNLTEEEIPLLREILNEKK